MIYLDYNATTPAAKSVLKEVIPYFSEKYANPSSLHTPGQDVRNAIDNSRKIIANYLGVNSSEIIFTSGATEANNYIIRGLSELYKKSHFITSNIEHPAVLKTFKYLENIGYDISYLKVGPSGIVNTEKFKELIKPKTKFVSIMTVNNEIGSIQPIKEIAKICKQKDIIFHTDAVQAIGKIPVNIKKWGIDALTLSGHKIYGPKGTGALYLRKGIRIPKLIHGGEHENNKRAGTENVAGIIGLGAAINFLKTNEKKIKNKILKLRNKLEDEIKNKIPQIIINGDRKNRVFNTLNVSFKYIEGESILLKLDKEKIAVSSGSACSSATLEPSHVLLALGLKHEDAHGSIRFSLGKDNSEKDIEKVIKVLPKIIKDLRQYSPLWEKYKKQVI